MKTAAADLMGEALSLRGVSLDVDGFNWRPWPAPERVLRVVGLRDQNPRALQRYVKLEALVLDLVPLTQEMVAAVAGLPSLRALAVHSCSGAMAEAPPGFAQLELLSLPSLDAPLERFERVLRGLGRLHTLQIREAEATTLPGLLEELRTLRELDISGVPIPDDALAAFRRARPDVRIVTSPINLGWKPGVPGVLRIPDGFAVDDVPATDRWETGFEMSVRDRQVTLTVRWRETPADAPDYQEEVHGPVDVETFVRQGPPIGLSPWERLQLRRVLEGRFAR